MPILPLLWFVLNSFNSNTETFLWLVFTPAPFHTFHKVTTLTGAEITAQWPSVRPSLFHDISTLSPHRHHPTRKPLCNWALFFHLLCPQPLATTNLLSVSTNLPILDVPFKRKRNAQIHGLLCLVSFTEHNVFKVSQLFALCLTVTLMCVSHRKKRTGENNLKCMLLEWWVMARCSLWEEEPCEPAKLERKDSREVPVKSTFHGTTPSLLLPHSLHLHSCLPLLYPASSFCLCLFLSFVHSSFLSLFLCFFFSLLCPLYRGPNGLALRICSCGSLTQQPSKSHAH